MTYIPENPPTLPLRYYKATLASLGYGELWRLANWATAPLICLLKACRMKMLLAQGMPEPVRLERMAVEPKDISLELLEPLNVLRQQAEELGFRGFVHYRAAESLIPGCDSAAIVAVHESGEIFANLLVSKTAQETVSVGAFISGYVDGAFFTSANSRPKLAGNPAEEGLHMPNARLAALFAAHQERRAKWAAGRAVHLVRTEGDLCDILFAYERSGHDWHVRRGAYIEMTQAEIAAARRQHQTSSGGENDPLSELSFRADFCGETDRKKVAEGFTLSGMITAEAIRATTCSSSDWMLYLFTQNGDAMLSLNIKGSLLEAVPGSSLKAGLSREKSKGGPAVELLERLLQVKLTKKPEPRRRLQLLLTLISRDRGVESEETRLAGEHSFNLQIEGVPGSFEFRLHPAVHEGRLKPAADLDREAGLQALAALLV